MVPHICTWLGKRISVECYQWLLLFLLQQSQTTENDGGGGRYSWGACLAAHAAAQLKLVTAFVGISPVTGKELLLGMPSFILWHQQDPQECSTYCCCCAVNCAVGNSIKAC